MGGIIGSLIGRHYAQKWWEESTLVKSAMDNIQRALTDPNSTADDNQIDTYMNVLRQRPGLKKMLPQIEQGIQRARAARDAQRSQGPAQPQQVAPEAAVTGAPSGLPSPASVAGPAPPPAEPPQLAPAFRSPIAGGSEGGPVVLPAPPPPNQVPLPVQVTGPSQAGGAGFGTPDYSQVPGRIFQERPYDVGTRTAAGKIPLAEAEQMLQQRAALMQLENQKRTMAWLTTPTSAGGPGMTVEQAADYIQGKQAQFVPTAQVESGKALYYTAGPNAGKLIAPGPNIVKDVPAGAALTSTPTIPGVAPGAVPPLGTPLPAPTGTAAPTGAAPTPGTPAPGTQVLFQQPQLMSKADEDAKREYVATQLKKNPNYTWSDADLPAAQQMQAQAKRIVGGEIEQLRNAFRDTHPNWSEDQVREAAGNKYMEIVQAKIDAGQPLTDEQMHNIAMLAVQKGQMPNFGMGSSKLKRQGWAAYADAIKESGGPGSVAAFQAEYRASTRALGDLETMRSRIGSFENAFKSDLQNAQDAAMRVPRSQAAKFNSWQQLFQANLEDYPELADFRAKTLTAIGQYSRLVESASATGQSSVDARKHAEEILNTAMANKSYDAAARAMRMEADNRVAGLDEEIKRRKEELRAGPLPAPIGGAATAGAPPVGTIVDGFKFKGGDHRKRENWEKVQ